MIVVALSQTTSIHPVTSGQVAEAVIQDKTQALKLPPVTSLNFIKPVAPIVKLGAAVKLE